MSELAEILRRLSDGARPVEPPTDLWRRGRRRRAKLAGVASGVAAVVVVLVAILAVAVPSPLSAVPAEGPDPVVPSTVYGPGVLDPTVLDDPPGPAALLVSGDGPLRGSDVWGYEGRSLLVNQEGDYGLLRSVGESTAGEEMLLSPDGRYVASGMMLEGQPGDTTKRCAILDLTTGQVRTYDGIPVAWAPDSDSLLIRVGAEAVPYDGSWRWSGPQLKGGSLHLLDPGTGDYRVLADAEGTVGFALGHTRFWSYAAFSADGDRLAIEADLNLYIMDIGTGTTRDVADLFDSRTRLAGPGAWLPDGSAVAVLIIAGCDSPCYAANNDLTRIVETEFRDPITGDHIERAKPEAPLGMSARILGWQSDGSAVMALYHAETEASIGSHNPWRSDVDYWNVGSVELLALPPGGGRRELVDLPGGALHVDVPRDLLDRFGGPSSSPLSGSVRWLANIAWPIGIVGCAVVLFVASILVLVKVRRRYRRRASVPRT